MARNTFGSDLSAAFGPQQAFGTVAAEDTYTAVPFYTHTLGRNQGRVADPVIGERLVRAPHPTVEGLIDHNGQWVCPFDLGNIGLYLRGLLGVPVTTDDAPNYTHVFKPGSGEPIPHSLQERVAADRYMLHTDLVVNALSSSLGREDGYKRLTVDFRGANETVLGASGAGNIGAALTVDRIMGFRGALKLDGAAVASVVSASWNYTNNFEPYDAPDRATVAGFDPGVPAFTSSLVARQTDEGHALYDAANDGTRFEAEYVWTLGATKELVFTIGNVVLSPSSKPVNGPAGQQYQFELMAEPDDEEADKAFFVATLKNQVASYALPVWA